MRDEKEIIAQKIESVSEAMCIKHIGHKPATWYRGGPSHNDDRLTATVDGGEIRVSDGTVSKVYDGDLGGVDDYVSDWLQALWDFYTD